MIEIKSTAQPAKPADERLPLIAGPMIWYAFAGFAILVSAYLFLFAPTGDGNRKDIGVFIGLWAPMFGILGLRAEMMELREDLSRRRKRM